MDMVVSIRRFLATPTTRRRTARFTGVGTLHRGFSAHGGGPRSSIRHDVRQAELNAGKGVDGRVLNVDLPLHDTPPAGEPQFPENKRNVGSEPSSLTNPIRGEASRLPRYTPRTHAKTPASSVYDDSCSRKVHLVRGRFCRILGISGRRWRTHLNAISHE